MNPFPLYPIDTLFSFLSHDSSSRVLRTIYGQDETVIHQRKTKLTTLLSGFTRQFPHETHAAILRVPGRINLMGVHIDHQGGYTNYIPIARETLFCVSPRADSLMDVRNLNETYPSFLFSIEEETPAAPLAWEDLIETAPIQAGFWGNYIKAGALRLQSEWRHTPLQGMNLLVAGDIPPNAGVSSSSTLVVGTVLSLSQRNALPVQPGQLVSLCGSAEWYVGTRGGAGDHAAMLQGKLHTVLNAGFKPFRAAHHPFPADLDVLLIHSGVESNKATNTRKIFNSRIAAYAVSLELFKTLHPAYADRLQHLRDISPNTLELPLARFYPLLKAIPIEKTAHQILTEFPQAREKMESILARFQIEDDPLPLREVLLFGICECQRAQDFPQHLNPEQINEAGRAMSISHDGDRVCTWERGTIQPYRSPFDDSYLDRLAELAANSQDSPMAGLARQPGGYRCSIPAMDRIVDECKTLPGVVGASLTGAGLGGAVIALVQKERAPLLVETLQIQLHEWNGEKAFVERCQPADGAGFVSLASV